MSIRRLVFLFALVILVGGAILYPRVRSLLSPQAADAQQTGNAAPTTAGKGHSGNAPTIAVYTAIAAQKTVAITQNYVGQVEPTTLVSRTHIPKTQWWAEQIGRRLVYIVLTLSLVIPVWVHIANTGVPDAVATLDATPETAAAGAGPVAEATPRTVVASMAPVAAPPTVATSEIVLRANGATWLEVVGKDGSVLAKELLAEGVERRFPTAQVRRMTIGNASAVTLENRGKPVDAAAHARANVARFEVSSDGTLAAAN